MLKRVGLGVAMLLAAGLVGGAGPQTSSGGGVKTGVLTCNVESGWGFVFGSTRDIRCVYHSSKGVNEHYAGHVSKYGVDIGYSQGGVLIWAVFAPTSDLSPGALEGEYGGATASATVGVGAGVNALIGGFDKSISLQPVSLEGNTGLNVAAGIAAMTLKHRR